MGVSIDIDFKVLSDRDLVALVAGGLEEQQRRAYEQGDIEAVIARSFEDGFDSRGRALSPWIVGSVIICPGSVLTKSALSHDCVFVNVDGTWVWEYQDTIFDEIRHVAAGGKQHQRSVSGIPCLEGATFDVIESQMRSGAHQMKNVRSYRVFEGALELVASRAAKPKSSPR